MKRVFIIHGWGGTPNDKNWILWLKKELEARGDEVITPQMPDTNSPRIENWVPHLAKIVGNLQETDVLIGHSMGCQTILRFLENSPETQQIDKVILVAGFGSYLKGLSEEEKVIAQPWLEAPINWDKVKEKAQEFIAIFSTNDEFVPLEENQKLFEEKLAAKIIVQENKGHFDTAHKITKLPEILEILK